MKVEMYCDGSCAGNGKVANFGGFGLVVVIDGQVWKTFKKGFKDTTNNEMELMGVLTAAKMALELDSPVEICSDSAYCVNIANEWMYNWAINNWTKSNKRAPENLSLVKALYEILNFNKQIKISKVKGHSDDELNKQADKLAREATKEAQMKYLQERSAANE